MTKENGIENEKKLWGIIKDFVEEFGTNWDCDGCTRFVGLLLRKKDIKFQIYQGKIRSKKNRNMCFPLHNWIMTEKGIIFDFKAKKWIGGDGDDVEYYDYIKISKQWLCPNGVDEHLILGILLSMGKIL